MSRQRFVVQRALQTSYIVRYAAGAGIAGLVMYAFMAYGIREALEPFGDPAAMAAAMVEVRRLGIVLAGIIVLAGALHGLFLSHRLGGSVYSLQRALKSIREGAYGSVGRPRKGDDLMVIGDEIIRLIEALQHDAAGRQKALADIRSLLADLDAGLQKNVSKDLLRTHLRQVDELAMRLQRRR